MLYIMKQRMQAVKKKETKSTIDVIGVMYIQLVLIYPIL